MKSIYTSLAVSLAVFFFNYSSFAQTDFCQDFSVPCNDQNITDPHYSNTYVFEPNREFFEYGIGVPDALFENNKSNTWIPIDFGDCFKEGEVITDISILIRLLSNDVGELEATFHLPNQLAEKGHPQVVPLDVRGNMKSCNLYTASIEKDFSELSSLIQGEKINLNDMKVDYQETFVTENSGDNIPWSYGGLFYLQLSSYSYYPFPSWPNTECEEIIIEISTAYPGPNENDPSIESVTHLEDVLVESNCQNGQWSSGQILRTWEVIDKDGMNNTCEQTINLEPIDIRNYNFNSKLEIDCKDVSDNNLEDLTFGASFNCTEVALWSNSLCNSIVTYEDTELPSDECGHRKLIRDWTFVDFCTGDVLYDAQIIEITDAQGPSIKPNLFFERDEETCLAPEINFGDFQIFDFCNGVESATMRMRVSENPDVYETFDLLNDLDKISFPKTYYYVEIVTTDFCGNVTEDRVKIEVADKSAPSFEDKLDLEPDAANCQSAEISIEDFNIFDCHEIKTAILSVKISEDPLTYEDFDLLNSSDPKPVFEVGETVAQLQVIDLYRNSSQKEVTIRVSDNTQPFVPEALSFESIGQDCLGPELQFEDFQISDVCGDLATAQITLLVSEDPEVYQTFDLLNGEVLPQLATGENVLEVYVVDEFGNETTSELSVTIIDTTAPTVQEEYSFEANLDDCAVNNLGLDDFNVQDLCGELDVVEATLLNTNDPSQNKIFDLKNGDLISGLTLGVHNLEVLAVDEFGNETVQEISVSVFETNGPLVQEELTFGVGEDNCSVYDLGLEDFDVKDLCSELDFVKATLLAANDPSQNQVYDLKNGDLISTLDLGTHEFEIVARDAFGNETIQLLTLTVVDNIPAQALCKNVSVKLIKNSENKIESLELDDGSSDNCANWDFTDLRRVVNGNPVSDWSESYDFEETDMGLFTFELRSIFENGEEATCISEVRVIAPSFGTTTTNQDTIKPPGPPPGPNFGGELVFKTAFQTLDFEIGNVYPNPFSDIASINVIAETEKEVELKIYNLIGKEIQSSKRTLQKGFNQLSIEADGTMKAGVYFLTISDGLDVAIRKFEKF